MADEIKEKKAPAKKAAAKPAAEKKAPAKKAAATETAAKKAPATKPAAEKKAPAKKAEAKPADKKAAKPAPAKAAAKPEAKKAAEHGIKITLVRSLVGRLDKQIATAKSLGLKKMGDTTIQPDNVATKGKIAKISHMVKVTNA